MRCQVFRIVLSTLMRLIVLRWELHLLTHICHLALDKTTDLSLEQRLWLIMGVYVGLTSYRVPKPIDGKSSSIQSSSTFSRPCLPKIFFFGCWYILASLDPSRVHVNPEWTRKGIIHHIPSKSSRVHVRFNTFSKRMLLWFGATWFGWMKSV